MKKAFKAIFCGLGLTAFLSTALIGSTIAYSQDKVEFIDETKIIETGSTYKTLIRYTTTSERDLLIDILGEDYKFYAGTRVPINPGSAEIEIEIEIPDDSKVTDRVGFRSVKLVPRGAEWREKIQEDIKDIEYQSPQPVQLEEFVKSINENNIVETDSPYKITVKYHALEARDLLVELLSKNYDYYAGKRVPVEAGSGEIEVTLQVPGNRIATNINGFRSIKLVPSGSDWKNTIKEALDPIEYKINTTGSGDMDRDGIPDNEDLAPNSRYKVPLFLFTEEAPVQNQALAYEIQLDTIRTLHPTAAQMTMGLTTQTPTTKKLPLFSLPKHLIVIILQNNLLNEVDTKSTKVYLLLTLAQWIQ